VCVCVCVCACVRACARARVCTHSKKIGSVTNEAGHVDCVPHEHPFVAGVCVCVCVCVNERVSERVKEKCERERERARERERERARGGRDVLRTVSFTCIEVAFTCLVGLLYL